MLKIETIAIADLVLDAKNLRKHESSSIAAIRASLSQFGQQRPIVIDAKNVVRAGNGTLLAARELKWKTIDCVRTKLSDKKLKAFAFVDNRSAELSSWIDDIGTAIDDIKIELPEFDFTEWDIEKIAKP